nr:MAG TPA: hypothetical protein [Caudoviricetes sp.]
MYLCINKINIVMWKEKNLVPFVVKYLAKKEDYQATTRELKEYLSSTLVLDDYDKEYTSSTKKGTKTNRFNKTVGNIVSHNKLLKLRLGETTKNSNGKMGIKLYEEVGRIVNIVDI